MKALVKKKAEPGLWMEEVPTPELGGWDVRIRVKKAAICGTDLTIYKWGEWAQREVPIPLTIGHEFVGEISEVGEHVYGMEVGQRVTAEGHITCGLCERCRTGARHLCGETRGIGYHTNGCFAEEIVVPARNIFHLPDSVSDNEAAIFDPFGNAVHTALSFPLVGERVLITGAGPIGIMAAGIARQAGARSVVVTDVNEYRLDLAKQMGATEVINVTGASHDLGGFTVGMEMSGNPEAFDSMIQAMIPGGKIALLGILPSEAPVDWDRIIFRSLHLKGIYGREIFRTWYQMCHLLEGGLDLSPVITHELPFDQYEEGFQAMIAGTAAKVILNLP